MEENIFEVIRTKLANFLGRTIHDKIIRKQRREDKEWVDNANTIGDFNFMMKYIIQNKEIIKDKRLRELFLNNKRQIDSKIATLAKYTSATADSIHDSRDKMMKYYLFIIANIYRESPTDWQLEPFKYLVGKKGNKLYDKAKKAHKKKKNSAVAKLGFFFSRLEKALKIKKPAEEPRLEDATQEDLDSISFDFYDTTPKKPKVPLQESWELIWDQINENN